MFIFLNRWHQNLALGVILTILMSKKYRYALVFHIYFIYAYSWCGLI